jgi:uncharacterized Zn finger protein
MTTETTAEQTGKAKIRALSEGVRVWVLEQGFRYVAPSMSADGTAYELTVHGGDISCTCLGALYGRVCKHIGAVALRLDAESSMLDDGERLYGPHTG